MLIGPVAEVAASVETTVLAPRTIGGVTIEHPVAWSLGRDAPPRGPRS